MFARVSQIAWAASNLGGTTGCTFTSVLISEDAKAKSEVEREASSDAGIEKPDVSLIVADEYRGGTRLQPIFLVSDDGFSLFQGFWDRELGTACNVDGVETAPQFSHLPQSHCLPIARGELFYADSACTQELVRITQPRCEGCASDLVTVPVEGSCGATPRVVRTGNRAKQMLYQRSGADCMLVGQGDARSIQADIDRQSLVAVAAEHVEGDAGLQARYLELADGSRLRAGFFYPERQIACSGGYDENATLRCMPALRLEGARTAGEQDWVCRPDQPAAWEACQEESDWLTVTVEDTQCPVRHENYRFFTVLLDAIFGRSCTTELGADAGGPFYVAPVKDLPPLAAQAIGGARLLDDWHVADGVSPTISLARGTSSREVPARVLHDSALGIDCQALLDETGVRRCLPVAQLEGPGAFFVDAACTQRAGRSSRGDGCLPLNGPAPESTTYLREALPVDGEDEPRWRVLRADAVVTAGSPRFSLQAGSCTAEAPFGEALDPHTHMAESYRIVDAAPPDFFAELHEVRR